MDDFSLWFEEVEDGPEDIKIGYGFFALPCERDYQTFKFEGEIRIIEKNGEQSCSVKICRSHSYRKGSGWAIRGSPNFAAPCLLTTNKSVRKIYDGIIAMNWNRKALHDVMNSLGRNQTIRGDNWFGIVRVHRKRFFSNKVVTAVTAFSTVPGVDSFLGRAVDSYLGEEIGWIESIAGTMGDVP